MVAWGGLTNSWEREVKGKGEKERYTHLSAEFQRIARRDKKAFLSDQCKEIEENNRTGKTWDLFKKIRDTKGTFHAKMDTIKDRNGMDLTDVEDIKKKWQEYWSGLPFPSPKKSVLFQSQRKKMTKNVQTTVQLSSFHMLARLC